jgi:putative addiction module antidote
MNKPTKLIPIGNSTGVILPREVLARLRVDRGDTIFISEGADGSVRITPYDSELEGQMTLAEKIMREDRDILKKLAE